MAYKGTFKPKNPEKYVGDVKGIIYRSFIELSFMRYLDSEPNVIAWASEEMHIKYISPKDNKVHKYFPDFLIRKIDESGKEGTLIVEIKHTSETSPPKKPKKVTKRFLAECMTWEINQAKWKAAEEFCKDRKWKFEVITQKDLNLKY